MLRLTHLNPIALRTAKTLQSFGRSECSRVKLKQGDEELFMQSKFAAFLYS